MVNWGGWGCSKRGVVGGWQGVMCGCCQMWMVRMVRVRTGGLAMGRGVGGVAVVHSVIHRQVPVRRAPIGSVHHSGRQGPSRGCECGFNFGKWFWSLNEVTTIVDTSSLIDSWRGSETLNTGNQNMILGAHPRPRPLTQDLQTSDDPSTAWRRHSRRFFCTFQATNTTLLSYTSFTHTRTLEIQQLIFCCVRCTCVTRLSLKYVANIFYKTAIYLISDRWSSLCHNIFIIFHFSLKIVNIK